MSDDNEHKEIPKSNTVFLCPFRIQELDPATLNPHPYRYRYRLADRYNVVYSCELTVEQFCSQRQYSISSIILDSFIHIRNALPLLHEIIRLGYVMFDLAKINITTQQLDLASIERHWSNKHIK